nr:META domain-containing protein [Roseovarius sp. EL26]
MLSRAVLAFVLLAALTQCASDETLAAYGGAEATWHLRDIDGEPSQTNATLLFPAPGVVSGSGPCNSYHGQQTAPYPWFEAKNISTTKRACPDLAAEGRYLKSLRAMTLSEIAGDTLILSNDAGREMIFQAQ